MEEIVKIIGDYGFLFVISGVVIFFIVKYGDKFLSASVKRLEDKNYMIDTLHEVVKNNTKALENNSKIIDNYTRNSHKMEQHIENLSVKMDVLSKEIIKGNTNIEIIKERK